MYGEVLMYIGGTLGNLSRDAQASKHALVRFAPFAAAMAAMHGWATAALHPISCRPAMRRRRRRRHWLRQTGCSRHLCAAS